MTVITCKNCNTTVNTEWSKQQFCNKKCEGEYKTKLKYLDFLEHNEKYCKASYALRAIKPHILKEQNNKCAICGNENVWNSKLLIFILDHIDGDASNNKRENIRLICPNCDSQLETYKSKNKNSARKERYVTSRKNAPVA